MKLKSLSFKKVSKPGKIKPTLEIYSEKARKNIKVTINPVLTEEERLKRIVGLSNSVTTG
ncbi:TPA: hypothetical protein DCX16_03500 [bacterium]|nr:hypothetical protein [bacterium]